MKGCCAAFNARPEGQGTGYQCVGKNNDNMLHERYRCGNGAGLNASDDGGIQRLHEGLAGCLGAGNCVYQRYEELGITRAEVILGGGLGGPRRNPNTKGSLHKENGENKNKITLQKTHSFPAFRGCGQRPGRIPGLRSNCRRQEDSLWQHKENSEIKRAFFRIDRMSDISGRISDLTLGPGSQASGSLLSRDTTAVDVGARISRSVDCWNSRRMIGRWWRAHIMRRPGHRQADLLDAGCWYSTMQPWRRCL